MKLFQALFRRKGMPNGHIYRGKQRLVKEVTPRDMQKLRNEYAIEEKNMFYLRHPYLTMEESKGHAIALGKVERNLLAMKMKQKEFKDNVRLEDRLNHLRFKESWD
ncbi:PREDICTED: ribosomal protein 63, mitochondrial [Nicrophorus vespilloides]|uniref:Ribosomal protein 63, mitochondrial n=1 Tax=Nicrophorus vespilloides TaxID=110193 RepID=A0ABM1N2K6_NICVS|nr:PREDICTED: ribosomal protein 63, mitochondrial [Nicrophorus vespilloides]